MPTLDAIGTLTDSCGFVAPEPPRGRVGAVVPPADLDVLRAVNQPAGAMVDWAMEAASNRGILLTMAGLAAIYAAFRSVHRWLAAILLLAAIGVADRTSAAVWAHRNGVA